MENDNQYADVPKQLRNSETMTIVTILIISVVIIAFSSIVLLGI
jgi:hypothetical protein